MKTIFPLNYVYVLRTTTAHHMVSFNDFYFHFLAKFPDLYLPMLCHVSHTVDLGYLLSSITPNVETAEAFLFTLNDSHGSISFPMELATNGKLLFLLVEIVRHMSRLETKVYTKPTDTGLLLHYNRDQHGRDPSDISLGFKILRKCQSKFDCLIYDMLFIKELKPFLHTQSDSIRVKLFL